MNITKTAVDKLPLPKKVQEGRTAQKRYYDDKLKGFGVRVTSGGTKAFFVEKLVNSDLKRITIGHYPAVTVEQARKEAHVLLGKMVTGVDPVAEKKAQRLKGVTLEQAFRDYLKARKDLKPTTIKDYERVMEQALSDWKIRRITNITRDMIVRRHNEHGKEHSKARANLAMRLLRAIFNYAMNEYQSSDGVASVLANPVAILSHARSWYRVERRQTVIKSHQLSNWYAGLQKLSEHYPQKQAALWQDYFLLVLFTGMRRTEAASLKWSDIDLEAKTFTMLDTKNRTSHTLPMSTFIESIFKRRRNATRSRFVFPADSEDGHVTEPRKAMLKVADLAGVSFTVHDLRRTFVTTAESLDISAYALKRLMNHKMNHDVTAGYLVMDVERLRKPMQQISDYLLKCMGVIKSADVTTIEQFKQGVSDEKTA